MRRYEWTRKGMEHNDAEGSYVHVRDAEAERAGLLAALREIAERSYTTQAADVIDLARAAIARAEGN